MASKKSTSRFPWRLFVLAFFTIGIVMFVFKFTSRTINQPDIAETVSEIPALTVSIHTPKQTQLPEQISANGSIMAWQEAIIGAEHSGLRLTEVFVDVGDTVKAGQVLATFSSDMVNAQLAQAVAASGEARAALNEATAQAKRARSLKGTGALSQQQIDQILAAEQTAKARLASAQAAEDIQRIRVRDLSVIAPDDGIISSRSATVGSVAQPGTELFRLIRKGRVEWRAELDAEQLSRIAIGTPVTLWDASDNPVDGVVRNIAPSLSPDTRKGLVYVDMKNTLPHKGLKAGMYARGVFLLGETPATMIRQQALVPRDGFNTVFTVNAQHRVEQHRVTTGRQSGEWIEITPPVPADARIVLDGAGFLQHGDLVRIAPAGREATP